MAPDHLLATFRHSTSLHDGLTGYGDISYSVGAGRILAVEGLPVLMASRGNMFSPASFTFSPWDPALILLY